MLRAKFVSAFVERLAIFRLRSYTVYFINVVLSCIGQAFFFVIMNWIILDRAASAYYVALYLILVAVPEIAIGPFLGVYVDRLDRRILASGLHFIRAAALLAAFVLGLSGRIELWQLYVIAAIWGTVGTVDEATAKTLIRELVPEARLLDANSATSVAKQAGALTGALVCGTLIAWTGTIDALLALVGIFAAAGTILLFLPLGKTPANPSKRPSFVVDLTAGWSYLAARPDLLVLYTVLGLIFTILSSLSVLIGAFAKMELHVNATEFGYISSAFGVGAFVSGLFLPVIVRFAGKWLPMTAGVWLLCASVALFAAVRTPIEALFVYFLVGTSFQVWLLYLTEAQDRTEMAFQGRVYSAFYGFSSVVSVFIYGLVGAFSDVVPYAVLYMIEAGILLVAAVIATLFVGAILKRRPASVPQPRAI